MTIDLLERAVKHTAALVRGVRPEQYDDPTPCSDWDVRALLNHLIAGQRYFAASAAGEAGDMSVWGVDHIAGGEPGPLYDAAARDALAAWATAGALDRRAKLPSGAQGPRVVDMYLMEEFVHGWDLATATGQNREGDPAVLDAVYGSWYGKVPAEIRESGMVFGAEQPCPPNATRTDELAAYLGRA